MRGRLGVYVDDVYRVRLDGRNRSISTDRAFLLFACEVGRRFDALALFGRTLYSAQPADYVLPGGVDLVELPHYADLRQLGQVGRASAGTVKAMWRALRSVDTVWVFGPHPFAVVLVALAAVRGKRIVLGVRQNTLEYYRSRLPSRRWAPMLVPVWGVDLAFRMLARRVRTTVVGAEIARRYGGERPTLLPMTVSLVPTRDVASAPRERDWSGTIELLTVGRLEPEKNPLLLVEALARLERERPGRYRLTWIGRGALEPAVRAHAAEFGVEQHLVLRGYVPFGRELLELYRRAHVFVHVSLTEGVPQVLLEALACGTPVVATDVGGVRAALDGERAGLLVPPRDVQALVRAVLRVSEERDVRHGLITHGLELARTRTLEAEAERVARFLAGA